MSTDPRLIRPAQRGRYGVPALHLRNQPVSTEMAFDRLQITVSGNLWPINDEQPAVEVIEAYRRLMWERAEGSGNIWGIPSNTPSRVDTRFADECSTVSHAELTARFSPGVHELSLRLTVNPTRSLIHLLSKLEDDGFMAARLDALLPSEFFGTAMNPVAADTLDGNDNAFARLDAISQTMGEDHASTFIAVFERQLKRWAIEAVAPHELGFGSHDWTGGVLTSQAAGHRVALRWDHLIVRKAEAYCERRHADAVGLLNRITGTILAAHSRGDWRTYEIGKLGGRIAGSTIVGVAPTAGITQVFYAKTRDRVRIETRFHGKIRDNFRGAAISKSAPLRDILLLLRREAVDRLQWQKLCEIAEEEPTPMVADFARLAGAIAKCAAKAKVDAEALFAELIASGGLTETSADGHFPRRLVRRLVAEGLIDGQGLQRRMRPGQARRYHLRQPYFSIATAIQSALGSSPVSDE